MAFGQHKTVRTGIPEPTSKTTGVKAVQVKPLHLGFTPYLERGQWCKDVRGLFHFRSPDDAAFSADAEFKNGVLNILKAPLWAGTKDGRIPNNWTVSGNVWVLRK